MMRYSAHSYVLVYQNLGTSRPEVTELTTFNNVVENDFEVTVTAKASDIRSASGGQGNEDIHTVVRAAMYINQSPETAGATTNQTGVVNSTFVRFARTFVSGFE